MVSIKEWFKGLGTSKESTANLFTKLINQAFGTLGNKFAKDIFTQTVRDMHEEFRQCKRAYFHNPVIHASAKTMIDLIKGDDNFVETNNSVLKSYMEQYMHASGLNAALDAAIEDYVVVGNGYMEVVRDSEGKIIKYLPFSNAEDIYIDYDYANDRVIRYIQRVLAGDANIEGASQITLLTPQGRISVYGVEIPVENLIHFKNGNNVFGVYGRSAIAAVLDDLRIYDTIERSIAVIARHKAVPRKILSMKPMEGQEMPTEEDFNNLSRKIKQTADFENMLINGEWQALDLGDGGKDINLEGYFEHIKRNLSVALAPDFLIFGELANRASSREQKQVYFLRVSGLRQNPENIVTRLLIMEQSKRLKENPKLAGTFKFQFGEFDILLPQEKEDRVLTRYGAGLITISEARAELDLPEIKDTDVFKWETGQPMSPFGFESVTDEKSSKRTTSKKVK